MESDPIRVLFDNSLYRFCQLDDFVVPPPEIVDGRVRQSNRHAQLRLRRPRAGEEWKFEQIPFLKRISGHARAGRVKPAISEELLLEHWSSSESMRTGSPDGELFNGVEFEHLPSAVERSRYQGLPLEEFSDKKVRLEFFEMLRQWAHMSEERIALLTERFRLPEFEVEGLRHLSRFCELCGSLPPRDDKIIDVFHLWTAERSDVRYFLTFDRKFINYMTATSRVRLHCRPILPLDLCTILDHKFGAAE